MVQFKFDRCPSSSRQRIAGTDENVGVDESSAMRLSVYFIGINRAYDTKQISAKKTKITVLVRLRFYEFYIVLLYMIMYYV